MTPSHNPSVQRGNGWTIVKTDAIQHTPGAHDIGAALGIADGTILLVILLAAESWVPHHDTITDVTAILRREGQMVVELTDGSTQPLDTEQEWSTTAERSLAGIVNIGTGLAKALVIAR
jgi:hypothetical protein